MKKIALIIVLVLAVTVCEAQKVTFVSEGFERGVKAHLGLGADEDVQQTQTDTITRINLSGLEIRTAYDVLCLPNVQELDLSDNCLTDVGPLAELDQLHVLSLKNNFLKDVDKLAFSHSDRMMVDIGYNFITDFTALLFPGRCRFTLTGMNRQQSVEESVFDVCQLYVTIDSRDRPVITYRGLSNGSSAVKLMGGAVCENVELDGTTHSVTVDTKLAGTTAMTISNGMDSDVTYIVPPSFHVVGEGETVTIETGLPKTYRIEYAGSQYGTVTVDSTMLSYTAPNERMSDVIAFSYYEGSQLRGYGRLYAGMPTSDTNMDGKVNALDIQTVINAAVVESKEARYDINGDGKVNALDIQAVINAATVAAARPIALSVH
jgi:hypothetical protein